MKHWRNAMLFCCCCMLCLLVVSTKRASPTSVFYHCQNSTYNPVPGSTYRNNLINFLLSAVNASRTYDFYNSISGLETDDGVYGLFMCRGDVSNDVCQDCVSRAAQEALNYCSDQKDATSWYEECFLRYSNQSFFSYFSRAVDDNGFCAYNKVTGQGDMFNQVLANSIHKVAGLAANDTRPAKKFAVQQANFSSSQSIYALAQCTPDLSSADCRSCLSDVISLLSNCSNERQGARAAYSSCTIRYEVYPFYSIESPSTSSEDKPTLGEGMDGGSRIIPAIVVPVAVSSLLFLIAFFVLIRRSRKINKATDGSQVLTPESLQYNLSSVQAATNNFSAESKIGEGGFGQVYKGSLPNGQEIAVKRLSRSSSQGLEEFKNEIVLVANLKHRNLVRLLGFCFDGKEKLLLYEFVPNKSLDHFLFDFEKKQMLDWSTRHKIIGGIARGLLYLHEDSGLRIIHRDLKSSNVLLDGDMNPKIADFGLARLFGADQSAATTRIIAGTYGYMSPEYAMHGHFSAKSDVFSFGVLVLEIVSGKKNSSFYQSDGAFDLPSYAWKKWRDGTPLALLDPTIGDSFDRNEVIQSIHIGLLCVQEDVNQRPTMASVVLMLNTRYAILPTPDQPAFFCL